MGIADGDVCSALRTGDHVFDLGRSGRSSRGIPRLSGLFPINVALLLLHAAQPFERVPDRRDDDGREQQLLNGKTEHAAL